MTDEELFHQCFGHLSADIKVQDEFPRPKLAHYCSIATLESILRGRQLWLSNPLYMNDLEEVRFGINTGMRLALANESLRDALASKERVTAFTGALELRYADFANEHAFNLYVACFSEIDDDDEDGRLSMWRAYGANGDGAALVLDVNPVSNPETEFNGLAIGRVHYGTRAQREDWLNQKVEEVANFVRQNDIPDAQLPLVAAALFERIKLMAIFSKHCGFEEEREWRLVYLHEHDQKKLYERHLGYHLTPRGIEPKLKLPIDGEVAWHQQPVDMKALVYRILLGPSVSNPLAKRAIERMLNVLGLGELQQKLSASSIPLRPIGSGV